MPLEEVLERLYARRRFGIRPGVDRVSSLLSRLGNPEKEFRSIHVVGTNGKGSTSAFLSSILMNAGHCTALFSSPHLVHFTERFRINGAEYQPGKLAQALHTVLGEAPEEATFFEIATALAAYIFREENVSLAVVEAGMGGRSDATAAIPGIMTIVTPIAIDHSDYLGATLAEIAAEKAGIIEPGTVVVCANQPEPVRAIIDDRCRDGCNLLKVMDRDFSATSSGSGLIDYHGIRVALPGIQPGIAGRYQIRNAALALAAAEMLDDAGTAIPAAALSSGISRANWPGRMELIPGTPSILLDGAHNPAGSSALAESLSDYPRNRLLLVTGVCRDKDVLQIYTPLLPLVDRIYTATPSVDRALSAGELSQLLAEHGCPSTPCGSVPAALLRACGDAGKEDLILVCGSLFVVGEVKAMLAQTGFTGVRG